MGAKPNPRMAEAISWMRETGRGPSDAAQHFGLSVGAVRKARQRAGDTSQGQAVTKEKTQVGRAQGQATTATSSGSRARVELDDEVREGLQRGARQAVAAIADDKFMRTDPQGWANICRGLDAVIRFAPDAVALRKKLAPDSAGGDGAVDDLAAAMGVDPKAPASVTVLAGGKRASS